MGLRMRNLILGLAGLVAVLAVIPCEGYAQIFYDPGISSFGQTTALCVVSGTNQLVTQPDQSCTGFVSPGGTNRIVLGGANTITLQGAPGGGDIIVGNGTHVTTLDGGTGDVRVGGQLSIELGGSVDMGGVVVHNVGTPVVGTDAANKAYVDGILNGNTAFTKLTVTGTSSFGSAGQTQIDSSGNITLTNGFGDKISMTSDVGNGFGGFKATSGTDSRVASLSAPGLVLNNGTVDTVVLDTQTGNASFSGDVKVGGGLTVTGTSSLNGGLNVIGGTTTDTLTVTGDQTVGGRSYLNGGATISGDLTVTPGTTVNMGGNRVENVGGPVLSTDAANKAYVDTSLAALGTTLNQRIDNANHRIDKAFEGTAIALALSTPIFQPGQKFVIQGGWGNFEGSNAVGFGAAGLLGRDVFGSGSTVTLSGGVGTGTGLGTVAGRGAVSIGW
jgi:hypothetical protein